MLVSYWLTPVGSKQAACSLYMASITTGIYQDNVGGVDATLTVILDFRTMYNDYARTPLNGRGYVISEMCLVPSRHTQMNTYKIIFHTTIIIDFCSHYTMVVQET